MVPSSEQAELTIDFDEVPPSFAMSKYVQHYPPPYHGLILDVDRRPDQFGIFTIYTYKDNTESFSDPQRESLWLWLKGMLAWLNSASPRHAFQTEELEKKP